MRISDLPAIRSHRLAWSKRRIIGQKRRLPPINAWTIPVRLEIDTKIRHLALPNTAINSKLRGSDLVRLKPG